MLGDIGIMDTPWEETTTVAHRYHATEIRLADPKYSIEVIITDPEPPQGAKARRSPQGMAGPCQGLQRRIGPLRWLPQGRTISGHPGCCARYPWRGPAGRERAYRLTAPRSAGYAIVTWMEYQLAAQVLETVLHGSAPRRLRQDG